MPKAYFGYLLSVNIIGVMLLGAINRRIIGAIRLDRLLKYATLFAAILMYPFLWVLMFL